MHILRIFMSYESTVCFLSGILPSVKFMQIFCQCSWLLVSVYFCLWLPSHAGGEMKLLTAALIIVYLTTTSARPVS